MCLKGHLRPPSFTFRSLSLRREVHLTAITASFGHLLCAVIPPRVQCCDAARPAGFSHGRPSKPCACQHHRKRAHRAPCLGHISNSTRHHRGLTSWLRYAECPKSFCVNSVSCGSSATDRFCGANIRFRTDAFSSVEYFDVYHQWPPTSGQATENQRPLRHCPVPRPLSSASTFFSHAQSNTYPLPRLLQRQPSL